MKGRPLVGTLSAVLVLSMVPASASGQQGAAKETVQAPVDHAKTSHVRTWHTGDISGVWSIGETANCATGNAWVLHKDGYYAEVALPDGGLKAVGMWKDEGATISYTHSHMPFADMTSSAPPRQVTVEQRTADRLVMTTYLGTPIIFNRCPVDAVKLSAGQAEH